jgi:hypothetical protein
MPLPALGCSLALDAQKAPTGLHHQVVATVVTEREEHRKARPEELCQHNGFGYIVGRLGASHVENVIG